MKKNKNLIILLIASVLVLTFAFFINPTDNFQKGVETLGFAPAVSGDVTANNAEQKTEPVDDLEQKPAEDKAVRDESGSSEVQKTETQPAPEQPASTPPSAPVQPADGSKTQEELTCTLSVRCDTVLANMDMLDPKKVEFIPKSGIIFNEQTVVFYEGESVFNLLRREMKKNKIHLEFTNTPVYNSAYIEGIANLYEFDCGELSGWMYSVNGIFPNYGCSRYELKNGDKIEFVYTCDLGKDVNGENSARNGR